MQLKSADVPFNKSPVSVTIGPGERSQTLRCAQAVPRVLVADNDESLRDLVADLLAFEGYFVTEAHDEAGVFRSLQGAPGCASDQFDLIVLGFQVQGALDIDTLTKLRASGCRTPVIVLAARSKSELASHLNELDALFLSKPFALENLRVLANHVIWAHECGFGHVSPNGVALTSAAQTSVESCDSPCSIPEDIAV